MTLRLITLTVLAVLTAFAQPAAAFAESDISWSMLDYAIDGVATRQEPRGLWEDRIGYRIDRIDPGSQLEIGFSTAPGITWWKSVQIRGADGRILLMLETQDGDHGGTTKRISVRQLAGARITFHKAKMFGIHTGMYRLPPDLTRRGGTSIFFSWLEDF